MLYNIFLADFRFFAFYVVKHIFLSKLEFSKLRLKVYQTPCVFLKNRERVFEKLFLGLIKIYHNPILIQYASFFVVLVPVFKISDHG